jgi:hypothetical protein
LLDCHFVTTVERFLDELRAPLRAARERYTLFVQRVVVRCGSALDPRLSIKRRNSALDRHVPMIEQ